MGDLRGLGGSMGDQPMAVGATGGARSAQPLGSGAPSIPIVWTVLAALALIGAAVALIARVVLGPRMDGELMLAAAAAAAVLGLRLVVKKPARPAQASVSPVDSHKEILDSAAPAVAAIDMDGRLTYLNPAAERMLDYHAADLAAQWGSTELLAPGEARRLLMEFRKLAGVRESPGSGFDSLMECLRNLPPSMMPGLDAQLRRRNGDPIPVSLHLSALRDGAGMLTGLMAVAVERKATPHQEQATRESQERYRDLFESSIEMIATLSPAGRFLYANPAWKRCFGLENSALLALDSFEDLFAAEFRGEVASLFRKALNGETIDRAPIRHHTADGRALELELSLSQRQKTGDPLAVRCLLRDATQQKQREQRLALQLVVSQIVGENASPGVASMRILEALCISQGWDLAIKWEVDAGEDRLRFSTAWGAPGLSTETLIHESMAAAPGGDDLPKRAWKEGRAVWAADLASLPSSPRVQSALRQQMVSGWAAPVRVGKRVFAVLEFYCHFHLREDREVVATVETVAASLGQMLARSHERGRAEELYRQQEVLLDSVADGICGVDRNGMVSFANPAAGRLLGAAATSLTGRSIHDVLHGSAPLDRPCNDDCSLRRATGHHMAISGEDNIFRTDGSSFAAEYAFTPIIEQGRFTGSVLSFRDVSQRFALDRLKDEFISTVSHELRTPLTSIRGALGLLSSGILGTVNEKAANLLRIAVSNSDRLVRLINDILDLERIQSGREPLAFRPVQLAELVRQAIEGMQPVADSAGVQLIHDTTQTEIAADPDRLLQVLTNLLSNAIKFSPPNSTVSVMMRPGSSGVTLSVIDHGRGIPADKLEAIFGRFQQVDASDSRQKGGSGLGLAICRTIVAQHCGRIWAERNPLRGSTFRVFLPYRPDPVDASNGPFEEEPSKGTVLLADANAETRRKTADQLARHGYRVIETATTDQTLSAAHEGAEAILLDTSLDGMNGWEILPLLRRLDPQARVPIVLLSVEGGNRPAGLPEGAEGWVPRPSDEEALLSELAHVLCGPEENVRILIVEDDRDLARVIADVFCHDEITVRLAHTLREASDACFEFQPHLLVLDIGLPDGDGFNLVDWLRQHENLARLPLVVYSGRELDAGERRQLTLGPTSFLTKARVQPQQLEALVLTMLRRSRQVEEAPARQSPVPNP
jgi:PAS domain S-box-containing protein